MSLQQTTAAEPRCNTKGAVTQQHGKHVVLKPHQLLQLLHPLTDSLDPSTTNSNIIPIPQ